MSTALVTTCYLVGQDSMGNDRFDRQVQYIKWYRHLKDEIGWDKIVLLDNASPQDLIKKLKPSRIYHGEEEVMLHMRHHTDLWVHRYDEYLGRDETRPAGYQYCWRGAYDFLRVLEMGFDRIIVIDSDCYVTSMRCCHWLKTTRRGWHAVWCPRHRFPENAIQVFNLDALQVYKEWTAVPWKDRMDGWLETSAPFTHVQKNFIGDRYGETNDPQPPGCDFYAQARLPIRLKFN